MLDMFPRPNVRASKLGSANARNNIFTISVWGGCPVFAGVLAQEVYERNFKRLIFVAVFVPLAIVAALVEPLLVPLALVPALALPALRPIRERMELMGHEIEAVVAADYYGEDLEAYELSEAENLTRGSYRDKGLFPRKSATDIAALIREKRVAAREWAHRRRQMIADAKGIGLA